jgi:hypothetical protein
MIFNDWKTKVKSLLLYDSDSDDSQVVSYTDALIVEWMYEAMFYVDNYRVGNTDTFLPATIDVQCEGGRVDLPAELYKLESVAIVKKAADEGYNFASTDGVDDKGINADCSAENLGTYYMGAMLRSSVTGNKFAQGSATELFSFFLTASDVWTEVFSTGTIVTGPLDAVIVGYGQLVATFSACDWSDVRLYKQVGPSRDVEVDTVVGNWLCNEQSSGSLDGVTAVDFSGNGYDGAYVGCTGGVEVITPGCETVIDLDPVTWDQRDEILNGKHCQKYTIDSRATELFFYPVPEDNEETAETQWLRVEWEGTKTDYSGDEVVPYGFDAAKNCADFINMNLAIKKDDKPAKATRFEKMFDRGMQRLFKTQRDKSQQG